MRTRSVAETQVRGDDGSGYITVDRCITRPDPRFQTPEAELGRNEFSWSPLTPICLR